MRPMDLGMANVVRQASTGGSAPTSPKTGTGVNAGSVMLQQAAQTHPLNLHRPSHYNVELLRTASSSGGVNSRSLPNIPSAMGRPGGNKELHGAKVVGRRSPPASVSSGASKQMLVRRSKSSAILPLRKHLIEKTLAEQQQKAAILAATEEKLASIKPIEEVMEEDMIIPPRSSNIDAMEVEVADQQPPVRHFAARLGPAGLSPLVIGEVSNSKVTQEYLSKLLPAPASSAAAASAATSHLMSAAAAAAAAGRTGLGFDPSMLRHECACGDVSLHPESPRRLQCIWSHLVATGLAEQCVKVAREATLEEIRSVHSEAHTIQYGVTSHIHTTSSKFQVLPCGGQGVDSDTYWNERYTSQAAKIAAGTVIELSTLVCLSNYTVSLSC